MQHHNSLNVGVRCSCLESGISREQGTTQNINLPKCREVIDGFLSGFVMWTFGVANASGAGLPPKDKPKLCDDACEKELENVWMKSLGESSGIDRSMQIMFFNQHQQDIKPMNPVVPDEVSCTIADKYDKENDIDKNYSAVSSNLPRTCKFWKKGHIIKGQ